MQTREMSFMASPPHAGCSCSTYKQGGTILGGSFGQCGNEGFDQVSAGITERFGSAEVGRIAFHEAGIEFVFADQQAESVAEPG